ncbi:MAG: azurin [Myxococcota bacterium]
MNLALESGDQMKYDKAQLSVQKNKRAKLTLKHTGKMKKEVMGHNFVLLKKDVDVQKFAVAAIAAKENGYIPAELKGDIIAHTKLLGGGESDTIEFDAPEPGTYVFICTFPGHYAVMKGEFVVT